MVDNKLKLAAGALVLLLAACQPTENPTNIAEGGRKAMDKAKAVEGQLQQGADKTRKAEDEQK
jgi:ABC-type uncharacterized transport system auxiliary subunit